MSHVTYVQRPRKAGRRTESWDLWSTKGKAHLGVISWHAPWRRYCFSPADETTYDAECLAELAKFCEDETARRQATRRAEREEAKS